MSARRKINISLNHPLIITFFIFTVIAFMSLAAEFLKPLALAVLFSFALAPISGKLERWGLPRAAAVVLTIVLTLGILGAIIFKVGQQLTMLANDLPKYEKHIKDKLTWLKPQQAGTLDRLTQVGREVALSLEGSTQKGQSPQKEDDGIVRVKVVSQPTFTQRLQTAVGPYLERLGVVSFVLILVLFMISNRENLNDRIIRLCGSDRVSLTTRTMEEAGQRISRYLGMFTLVNSTLGLIVGLGLWAIGLRYAVLWGVLFALLRFIPYVGTATAAALPLVFSFAYFESWREPLMIVALFATLETMANSFLEPVIYGRTTGVSALGLLVAAMFWTWLWGTLGLLLSTPLTVCLAVLGKYVSGLRFFAIMLGEDDPLQPDVRFYQRLLTMKQDDALQHAEAALKQQPREQVFDEILVPTLSRAERDRAQGNIDEREQAFIWRVIGELIDRLEETPAVDLKTLASGSEAGAQAQAPETAKNAEPAPDLVQGPAPPPSFHLLGVPANDHAEVLVLRMLALLLPRSESAVTIIEPPESPLRLVDKVAEEDPDLIVLSYLPPTGGAAARYLVRRLRARFSDLPILVGCWTAQRSTTAAARRFTIVGGTRVAFRLGEARDLILQRYLAKPDVEPTTSLPAAKTAPATV